MQSKLYKTFHTIMEFDLKDLTKWTENCQLNQKLVEHKSSTPKTVKQGVSYLLCKLLLKIISFINTQTECSMHVIMFSINFPGIADIGPGAQIIPRIYYYILDNRKNGKVERVVNQSNKLLIDCLKSRTNRNRYPIPSILFVFSWVSEKWKENHRWRSQS